MTMKMKEITKKVEIIDDIECNWCKKKTGIKKNDRMSGAAAGNVNVHFGAGSINKNKSYRGDICDDCFEKHIKKYLKHEGEQL